MRAALVLVLAGCASAGETALAAPLTTLVEAARAVAGPRQVAVEVVVPAGAPADLGLSLWVADRGGRWFQRPLAHLAPGSRRFVVLVDGGSPSRGESPWRGEGHRGGWDAAALAECPRTGVALWSAGGAGAGSSQVDVRLEVEPAAVPLRGPGRILDLDWPAQAVAGEAWEARCRVQPMPADPYDPEAVRLDLLAEAPDGRRLAIPGFWREPQALADGGDRELARAAGPGRFVLRWRPDAPGRWRLRLEAAWAGGARVALDPPAVEVAAGAAGDPYLRVDGRDPRFFVQGGRFRWPVGLNLHSPFDRRSAERQGTVLTPERGSLVYADLLARLAAAGGDACEVWMASWNLALEWRGDWPGFHGLGRFSQANAARLDAVLAAAERERVLVNLVVNNHGQASAGADREWLASPWNEDNGGPLDDPRDLFSDPAALAGQERLRRYLVARWADHPALLGWKLWSEVNLTAARGGAVRAWHAQAAARWHALDSYRHPVTSHWSGDYTVVDRGIAALPGLDYLCIDAYRRAAGGDPTIAQLLWDSAAHPARGLAAFAKPLLVTEYGAASGGSPEAVLDADQRSGAWAALVAGHAGAPMLWWWEWVDQGGRWGPYRAIRAFIAGEDLRGAEARPLALAVRSAAPLWCRAWARPGRVLAYLVDPRWARAGAAPDPVADALVEIAADAAPGVVACEWWDADAGAVRQAVRVEHAGGPLRLAAPLFSAHLALKVWRP